MAVRLFFDEEKCFLWEWNRKEAIERPLGEFWEVFSIFML